MAPQAVFPAAAPTKGPALIRAGPKMSGYFTTSAPTLQTAAS
jgi:hypothetical protein